MVFSIGVEEEYHLVDAETLTLRSAEAVVASANERLRRQAGASGSHRGVASEISTSQIEVETEICDTLTAVRSEIERLRSTAIEAAAEHGCRVLAMGTHPFSSWREQRLSDSPRYVALYERWGILALQQLITGCHVHVGVDEPDLAVSVMDRVRPWLPPLLALSASSPFWEGTDTGYASYRTVWFGRWPLTGPPEQLGSRAAFDELVGVMAACGALDDATHIYWDVRPSSRYPTLEFRLADVCPSVDDAVLQAALARSLTRTFAAQAGQGVPVPAVPTELVRVARWRAARHGLDAQLVDPEAWQLRPAAEVLSCLMALLRPDLEDHGEWAEVVALVEQVVNRGTAAARYREMMARTGDLKKVTASALEETAGY